MALTSKVLEEKARHTKSNMYGKVCKSQLVHGKHISSLKHFPCNPIYWGFIQYHKLLQHCSFVSANSSTEAEFLN